MTIYVNYEGITDLDKALTVIHKLVRGMNNCPSSDFSVCEKCGEIKTDGWICPNCGYDGE